MLDRGLFGFLSSSSPSRFPIFKKKDICGGAFYEISNEFCKVEYLFPYGVHERKADEKEFDSSDDVSCFLLLSLLGRLFKAKTNILSESCGNKHDYSSRA